MISQQQSSNLRVAQTPPRQLEKSHEPSIKSFQQAEWTEEHKDCKGGREEAEDERDECVKGVRERDRRKR